MRPSSVSKDLCALCVCVLFAIPRPFASTHPVVVCRGVGNSLSVREQVSWADFAQLSPSLLPRQQSCDEFCINIHPRYECLGVCQLAHPARYTSVADDRRLLCGCSNFTAARCKENTFGGPMDLRSGREHSSNGVVCRCGTPGAAVDAPEPSFDSLQSSGDEAWREAHASYWQDSDGFDQLWVKEPLQSVLEARISMCSEMKLKRLEGGDDVSRSEDECNWAARASEEEEEEEDYGEAMEFPGYFETLSTDPRVYYYPQFLSESEVKSLSSNVSE